MVAFHARGTMRALRRAAGRPFPGKPLVAITTGVAAAASLSIGLASAVGAGINDPAPYPNAKAAPAPQSQLFEYARTDPNSPVYRQHAGTLAEFAVSVPESLRWLVVYGDFWNGVSRAHDTPDADAPSPELAVEEVTPDATPVETPSPATTAAPDADSVNASVEQQNAPNQVLIIPALSSEPEPIVTPTSPPPPPAPVQTPPPAAEPQPVVEAPAPDPGFYMPASVGSDVDLESRLLAGINAERAKAGLPAYVSDPQLIRIARVRSQQMVDQGYFGHTDANGQYMYTALLGYYGIGYAWAGENLALNNYSAAESPDRALISLMNSPTHRANILAGDFFRIGVGVVDAPDGRKFYSMIFIG